ncbi:DoxX family protein [Brevibacterium litoralis]|uniref:DoxX family protein n=1 Tax=Brevibacterium litoralis TaxID=3138935 RepID=UPI0032EDB403
MPFNPVRLLARPMLASAYIGNGIARVRRPQATASALQPALDLVKKKVDLPVDATLVARATGVAQVAAGALLAVGKFPRFSAGVLVGTYVLDAVAEQVSPDRTDAGPGIIAKTSMLGGALLATADTAGRPDLAWRLASAKGRAVDGLGRLENAAIGALESTTKSLEDLAS